MNKEEVYRMVFGDLRTVPMFSGKYDAEHGSAEFMYGVEAVMTHIASECCNSNQLDRWMKTFYDNMSESQKRQ